MVQLWRTSSTNTTQFHRRNTRKAVVNPTTINSSLEQYLHDINPTKRMRRKQANREHNSMAEAHLLISKYPQEYYNLLITQEIQHQATHHSTFLR